MPNSDEISAMCFGFMLIHFGMYFNTTGTCQFAVAKKTIAYL